MPKYTVLQNELGVAPTSGGLYALYPWETLDKSGRGLFKIGIATRSLRSRLEQYHTYLPEGLFICDLIVKPDQLANHFKTLTMYYQDIEIKIMQHIIQVGGGQRLYSSTRIKNSDPENSLKGETEWVYCTPMAIHKAFEYAHNVNGGELQTYNLNQIGKTYQSRLKKKPNFEAKIVYPLKPE